MNITPVWLVEAFKSVGIEEIVGEENHPKIVSWWARIFRRGIKDDETPWCAAFVGAMLEGVGIKSTRFESAGSYRTWGTALSQPAFGAVCTLRRPGGNHVAFCVGRDARGNIVLLGGNQSNKVTTMTVPLEAIDSWRWPNGLPIPQPAPLPVYAGVPNLTNMA